jgi:hypothetical protein
MMKNVSTRSCEDAISGNKRVRADNTADVHDKLIKN